ncbi:MAG: IS21-like element helper ATPase IstB [Planctomycetales bacterium]
MRIEQTRKLLSEGVLPSPAPTQDVEALRLRLQALKLGFAAEALGDFLTDAVKLEWSAASFLDALLRRELERQEERRIAQALRISHLPTGPMLSNFDFAFQPTVSRSQIETLATCQWIADRHGLLLMGQPGVGKSHLAISLGVRAIESGFSVAYHRLDELMHQLKKDAEISPTRLKHKKYMASNLLIIDEMGFDPFTREEASLFFRVVSHRYQRGSICITTNKGIADWPELFAGDEALAGAILDRLLHSAHVLSISGRSYRLKELDEELQRRNGCSPKSSSEEPSSQEEPPA